MPVYSKSKMASFVGAGAHSRQSCFIVSGHTSIIPVFTHDDNDMVLARVFTGKAELIEITAGMTYITRHTVK